jgi:hypothetical protein
LHLTALQAKFRLMQQMGMERKTKKELEQKIFAMESKVFERRQKLGEYNALFMSLDGAAERAPRQRLGAREAVSGTRRIIDINLHKLQSEISTQSLKLNRARASNLHLREKVDLLRKEHLTFRKLFSHMGAELDEIKEKIKGESPAEAAAAAAAHACQLAALHSPPHPSASPAPPFFTHTLCSGAQERQGGL